MLSVEETRQTGNYGHCKNHEAAGLALSCNASEMINFSNALLSKNISVYELEAVMEVSRSVSEIVW